MYEYKAVVDRVIDGDTIDCTIDLGFYTWKKVRVRLNGINAPESRTRNKDEKAKGLAAKAKLEEVLSYNNAKCILHVLGLDKFGRALATVFVNSLSPLNGEDGITLINVNNLLIEEGHAVKYDGGKR